MPPRVCRRRHARRIISRLRHYAADCIIDAITPISPPRCLTFSLYADDLRHADAFHFAIIIFIFAVAASPLPPAAASAANDAARARAHGDVADARACMPLRYARYFVAFICRCCLRAAARSEPPAIFVYAAGARYALAA